MRILAVVHQPDAPPGTFGDVVRTAGAELVEHGPLQLPDDARGFGGVIAFGGGAHPDQDAEHPWLVDEVELLRGAADAGVPTLGICLGGELLARALGGEVGPAPAEIGFVDVEVSAPADPVLGELPPRFEAFQWHSYGFSLPPGAQPLARNRATLQAFRRDDAWGLQFHPEVDRRIAGLWADEERRSVPPGDYDEWTRLGASMCRGFLRVCGMRL